MAWMLDQPCFRRSHVHAGSLETGYGLYSQSKWPARHPLGEYRPASSWLSGSCSPVQPCHASKERQGARHDLEGQPERHIALAKSIGVPQLIRREGLLYAYPDRSAFEAEKLAWHLRRITGLEWQELDEQSCGPASLRCPLIIASVYWPRPVPIAPIQASMCLPLSRKRSKWRPPHQAKATSFRLKAKDWKRSRPTREKLSVSAPWSRRSWSKALARMAGDRIPLESERGYHGVIAATVNGPKHPVMPSDGKMANTPTAHGSSSFRAGGTGNPGYPAQLEACRYPSRSCAQNLCRLIGNP